MRGYKSDNSIEVYREIIQVLTIKMLDSDNKNLGQFRLFRFDEDSLNEDVVKFIDNDKLKSSLKKEVAVTSPETIESHQHAKSNYLLPLQAMPE